MSIFTQSIIKHENSDLKDSMILIIDDHGQHLKSHIKYFYRKGMLIHIVKHLYWAYKQYKLGLPSIIIRSK